MKAERSNRLPSECVPGIEEVACDWTIWQFDNAVHFFMTVIKNALEERVEADTKKEPRWEAKYSLDQLLDDDFRLPRPLTQAEKRRAIGAQVKAMFGMSGTRKSKAKPGATPKPFLPPSLAEQWLARGRKL